MDGAAGSATRSARGSATRSAARIVAELAITAGVLLVLFVVYLLVWTDHGTARAQQQLSTQFHAQEQAGTPAAASAGDGVAILHVPALGRNWHWVVVEGVADDDLALGPGHFPGTALPGQVGNFAVAGHRATHGQPFAHLDKVKVGDPIVVETVDGWFTYQVTWTRILSPTATDVLAPVAGHPGQAATQRTLTLVTCNPRWGSSERLVVGAQLVEQRSAAAGPPASIS
jgi:sortase A